MWRNDHDRPTAPRALARTRGSRVHRAPSAVGRRLDPDRLPARRGADGVDDAVARLVPAGVRHRAGRPVHRHRRARLRRLLSRRHGSDGRARSPTGCRRAGGAGASRHHDDAAERRCSVGRRRAGAEVRIAALADGHDGDRREPVRAAIRSASHRSPQGARVRLVLPRHGRRGVCDPGRRRERALAAGHSRRTRAGGGDHQGRAVQRPRCARSGACAGRRCVRARRAGADQHRDRAARRGVPQGASRALRPHGDLAHHRRDPHHLCRPRWSDRGVGTAARLPRDRQDHRRRDARGGLRDDRAGCRDCFPH